MGGERKKHVLTDRINLRSIAVATTELNEMKTEFVKHLKRENLFI